MNLGDPSVIALGQPRGLGQRSTAEVACPRSMVGRVIGKNGETIKALQLYTNALIQIDQSTDPTRVTISGTPQSLQLAVSMVTDICKGTFKGFALLRQLIMPQRGPGLPGQQQPFNLGPSMAQQRPIYAPGYGLIPPSQLYGADGVSPVAPGTTLLDPSTGATLTTTASGGVQLIGGGPMALQLPPGYQYATMQQLGGGGGLALSGGDQQHQQQQQQIMVQNPYGGMQHMTASGQLLGDGQGVGRGQLLGQMQLSQQVYAMPQGGYMAAAPGGYATTTSSSGGPQALAYYQPQEYVTAAPGMQGGEQLQFYQQADGTVVGLTQAQAQPAGSYGGLSGMSGGSSTSKALLSMQHGSQQHQVQQRVALGGLSARPSSGSSKLHSALGSLVGGGGGGGNSGGSNVQWSSGGNNWVDLSKVGEGQTMGQVAVSELLATSPNASAAAAAGQVALSALTTGSGGQGGSGGSSSAQQQQQLVQVIGPEGKVSYYLQGPASGGAEHGGN